MPDKAKKLVTPIVEITRGRKKRGTGKGVPLESLRYIPGIYDFDGNVNKFIELFQEQPKVVLDITREDGLTCIEIDEITSSKNGYSNWVKFVSDLQSKTGNIAPTLIVNPSENETPEEHADNLKKQFHELSKVSKNLYYRCSVLIDPEFVYDLAILKEDIENFCSSGGSFNIELDHEFILPRTGTLHASRTTNVIRNVSHLIPSAGFVILSTSFPSDVAKVGNAEHDLIRQEEVYLFEQIRQNTNITKLFYGDYGSINPIRNDNVIMRGWRPRIDVPSPDRITYYYREKKEKDGEYNEHYISVAQKAASDSHYAPIEDSWGFEQIEKAKVGLPPGKSPSFWISVRMEIHVLRQLQRLGFLA